MININEVLKEYILIAVEEELTEFEPIFLYMEFYNEHKFKHGSYKKYLNNIELYNSKIAERYNSIDCKIDKCLDEAMLNKQNNDKMLESVLYDNQCNLISFV